MHCAQQYYTLYYGDSHFSGACRNSKSNWIKRITELKIKRLSADLDQAKRFGDIERSSSMTRVEFSKYYFVFISVSDTWWYLVMPLLGSTYPIPAGTSWHSDWWIRWTSGVICLVCWLLSWPFEYAQVHWMPKEALIFSRARYPCRRFTFNSIIYLIVSRWSVALANSLVG